MRCPTISELPSPPPDKTGWPWTGESSHLPDTWPSDHPWPKISIVTPSLNQGQFIEETIRSVLLQGYPDLEYIIIDGGSTDNTVEVIKKYEKWIAYWTNEPDNGQPHAINKGFKKATGNIVAWINSDDYYAKGVFAQVVEFFVTNTDVDMIYGDMLEVYQDSGITKLIRGRKFSLAAQMQHKFMMQPTCFWRSRLLDHIGYLNETYHNVFDLEYFLRAGLHSQIRYFPALIANFRIHPGAKTQQLDRRSASEGIRLYENLFSNPDVPADILKLKEKILKHWYERMAKEYFRDGMYLQARRSFWQAISLTPMRLQNITLYIYMFDTFFRTNWGQKFQNLSLKIRPLFKQS